MSWKDGQDGKGDGHLPLARQLLIVLLGNTMIGVVLWATTGHPSFVTLWGLAQCVGLAIWSANCLLKRLLHGRVSLPVCIALSIAGGVPIGLLFAHLLGLQMLTDVLVVDPLAIARYVLLGAVFSLAFHYFFHSRMRIVALERERQAAALREATGQKAALLADLRLLQAQIEPHFLFNTLANLHSLIGRDDALAKQLLEQLNDYLRASLVHSRARHATLGDEFDMLKAYCAIQQTRMGGRLRAAFEVAPDLLGESFPPMLLQPLVENAIIHGIEPKLGAGEVHIAARREAGAEGDMLHLVVRDDGVGIGTAGSSGGHGIGLANIRERLAVLFAGKARIELKENTPAGVLVELWVPLWLASERSAP